MEVSCPEHQAYNINLNAWVNGSNLLYPISQMNASLVDLALWTEQTEQAYNISITNGAGTFCTFLYHLTLYGSCYEAFGRDLDASSIWTRNL